MVFEMLPVVMTGKHYFYSNVAKNILKLTINILFLKKTFIPLSHPFTVKYLNDYVTPIINCFGCNLVNYSAT